jgi:hypothetical protein
VSSDVEDGEMISRCENCGWQKIERKYFYVTGWEVEIRQALGPVDILEALLTSSETAEFLRPRLKCISYLSNYPEASREYLLGEVNTAYQLYLRQMIVLAVTYAELMLKDFYFSLFVAQHQRMHQYLAADHRGKATVSLNEIINTTSREDLLAMLAERASLSAVKVSLDKVVERLVKECRIELERPIIEDLGRLIRLRNEIVHGRVSEDINIKLVHNSFGLLLCLLYVLTRAASEYRMPYWDDSGFIEGFERQSRQTS